MNGTKKSGENMYIGRENYKNVLSYVDFTRICNDMSQFSELTIDILINGITFSLQYSAITFKWR